MVSYKGMLSSQINTVIDDDGRVLFAVSFVVDGLSKTDLDNVLNSLDVKDGTVQLTIEPLIT